MGSEYLHAVYSLLAILGLVLVLFFFFRKSTFAKRNGQNPVNIIHAVPVGAKEKVVLIEVNKAYILLGVTANHIGTLHVFDSLEASSVPANLEYDEKKFFLDLERLKQEN